MNKNLLVILIFGALLSGCQPSFTSQEEMYKWLNDTENGMTKERVNGGIKFTAKILPVSFLVVRELHDEVHVSQHQFDSIIGKYKGSLTILLSIEYVGVNEKADIVLGGVKDVPEFKQRVEDLNFNIKDQITLQTSDGDFAPRLVTMENVYGLKEGRTIYLVFAPDEENINFEKINEFDLVLEDEIFNTGINHFLFKGKDINNTPKVNYWKIS